MDPPRRTGRSGAARRRPGPDEGSTGGGRSSAAIAVQRLTGAGAEERSSMSGAGGGRRDWREPAGPLSRVTAAVGRIRPVKVLSVGVFSLTMIGIVANAVMFQKGRHPAPLLGQTATVEPTGQPDVIPRVAAAPAIQPPPAESPVASSTPSSTVPTTDDGPAPGPAPRKAAPVKHAVAKPHREDGIGQLLRAASLAPGPTQAVAGADRKSDPALMAAQRQLARLGYAVNPDGRMSAGTRHAVAQFEHDRHLRGGDALTPALRRQIAAAVPANPGTAAAKVR